MSHPPKKIFFQKKNLIFFIFYSIICCIDIQEGIIIVLKRIILTKTMINRVYSIIIDNIVFSEFRRVVHKKAHIQHDNILHMGSFLHHFVSIDWVSPQPSFSLSL